MSFDKIYFILDTTISVKFLIIFPNNAGKYHGTPPQGTTVQVSRQGNVFPAPSRLPPPHCSRYAAGSSGGIPAGCHLFCQ